MAPLRPTSTLFPYTTLFRSSVLQFIKFVPGVSGPSRSRRVSARIFREAIRYEVANAARDVGAFLFVEKRVTRARRSEEHTSELQSQFHLVCRLLLEKKKHGVQPPADALRLHRDAAAVEFPEFPRPRRRALPAVHARHQR